VFIRLGERDGEAALGRGHVKRFQELYRLVHHMRTRIDEWSVHIGEDGA
jgi:hypothetical protein